MKCPDAGTWQAYLDEEVTEEEKVTLQGHSQNCQECTDTLHELSRLDSWSSAQLEVYRSNTDRMVAEQPTFMEPKTENDPQKMKSKGATWMKRGLLNRWIAVAASVFLLAAAFTITPVQQAVANFLSIFRVQQIEVVQLNPGDMQQMADAIQSKAGEVDLQQFGKVDVEKNPEHQRLPLNEIAAEVPFKFKQPAIIPNGFKPEQKATFISEGKSEFRFNVAHVNSLLRSLDSKTLLPESLDGKAFSISTPAVAQVNYVGQDGAKRFSYSQFESPEIVAPPGVDPSALRGALLDLPILPENLRTQLTSIDDWQHTMVLPAAENTEELMINGNKAILAQGNTRDNDEFSSLIWIDGGIIYQLSGNLDRADTLEIAKSFQHSK